MKLQIVHLLSTGLKSSILNCIANIFKRNIKCSSVYFIITVPIVQNAEQSSRIVGQLGTIIRHAGKKHFTKSGVQV